MKDFVLALIVTKLDRSHHERISFRTRDHAGRRRGDAARAARRLGNLAYLVFCLVVLAVVVLVLERVRASPFGRVLRAIREDAQVAAFAGKDVLRFKVKAFAIGGAVAGLAGALYAHYSATSCPKSTCRC